MRVFPNLDGWRYQLLGPTTAHLRFEVCLLCSLILLTVGSLSGLYKQNFGTKGDVVFICLLTSVLSRHLVFRLMCTWDPFTHHAPSIRGILSHFLQTHVSGGQTFDRPPTLKRMAAAHHHGSQNQINYAPDRMLQYVGGSGVPDPKMVCSLSQVLPDSLVYALELPRRHVWYPMAQRFQLVERIERRLNASPRLTWLSNTWIRALQYSVQLWNKHGPTIQCQITVAAFLYYPLKWYSNRQGKTIRSFLFGGGIDMVVLSVTNMDDTGGDLPQPGKGNYDRLLQPTESEMMAWMLTIASLFGLVLLLRVIAPLPDLVASTNVIRDVRTDARMASHLSSSLGGTANTKKSQRGLLNYIPSRRTVKVTSDTAPWVERQVSIITSRRLVLLVNVLAARVLENVFLVAILPRTHYVCRATGHCQEGPAVWDLARLIFPAGYKNGARTDGYSWFHFMERDLVSLLLVVLGAAVVSTVLLLVQMLVLNRAYLNTLSYVASEWKLIQSPLDSTNSTPVDTSQPGSPALWQPKRKYKRGDRVFYPAPAIVYEATCNSPDSRPSDWELDEQHEILRKEVGHISTSETLHSIGSLTFSAACWHLILFGIILVFGARNSSCGVVWTIAGYIVCAGGIISTVSTPNGQSRKSITKLQRLSHQIMDGYNLG